MDMTNNLLLIDNLYKTFPVKSGLGKTAEARAVDGVGLSVAPGEVVGLVGESGCGKSTLGRCLVRLYDISAGKLRFQGREIGSLNRRQMRPLRGEMPVISADDRVPVDLPSVTSAATRPPDPAPGSDNSNSTWVLWPPNATSK